MRILFLGDVVGNSGCSKITNNLLSQIKLNKIDFVIVNAEKVVLTGNKRRDKIYYWHTGYPGGIKNRTADQLLVGPFPDRVIHKAVERMLPKTKLGKKQIGKLKIYAGGSHPHEAQSPQVLDIGEMNQKNKRSV